MAYYWFALFDVMAIFRRLLFAYTVFDNSAYKHCFRFLLYFFPFSAEQKNSVCSVCLCVFYLVCFYFGSSCFFVFIFLLRTLLDGSFFLIFLCACVCTSCQFMCYLSGIVCSMCSFCVKYIEIVYIY